MPPEHATRTTLQHGIRIVWGSCYCPPLPAGYTLIRGIKQSARARNAAGQDFLIRLHPNLLFKILPSEDPRVIRADFANPIPF